MYVKSSDVLPALAGQPSRGVLRAIPCRLAWPALPGLLLACLLLAAAPAAQATA